MNKDVNDKLLNKINCDSDEDKYKMLSRKY